MNNIIKYFAIVAVCLFAPMSINTNADAGEKYRPKQFKDIVMTFNSLLVEGVIDNRDGVELPDGIGFIFMASCPPTKKENIKNMIDNLDKGDNTEAQKNFNDAMADKVSATLDDAKTDVAKSMFTGQQGVQAPEVDVFSGENIETPAEETPSEEDAQ